MFGLNFGYQSARKNTSTTDSSQERILTPEQQGAMAKLFSFGTDSINDPMKSLEGIRTGAFNKINKTFDAAPKNLMEASAARGNAGAGGNLDRTLKDLDIARYSALSSVENDMAPLAVQQQQAGAGFLQNLLSQVFAQKGTSTTNSKTGGGWNIGASAGS